MTKFYRVIAGIIGVALAIQGCSGGSPSASPQPTPGPTPARASEPDGSLHLTVPASLEASPEATAAALADPNRVEAGVWFLLRGLGIGVYTGDGKQVLAGSETSSKDFWLYDFEIPLLVRLAAEPSRPFSEFQQQLHDLGLKSGQDETLKQYKDIYDANSSAYLPGLFAAMNLHFDGDPEITPLQEWLLLLDTFLPPNPSATTLQAGPSSVSLAGTGMLALSRQGMGSALGELTNTGHAEVCGFIRGGAFQANWGLANSMIVTAADLVAAGDAYYAIHGPLLARAVKAELRPSPSRAHEGHGGLGDSINFNLVLDIDYRVDGVIGSPLCGAIVNLDPPLKAGGLPAAKVWWRLGSAFKSHGSFKDIGGHDFDGSSPTETDPYGRTSITFQARQEPANGQGQENSSKAAARASFDPRPWIAAMGLTDPRLLAFLPATIDISSPESVTLEWHEQVAYEGEGKYRIYTEQSDIEVISGYEFSITFRANADGTISGEGVLHKVEAFYGGQGVRCNYPEVSSLTFPPMRVTGKVRPDATFQLTIEGPPSTNTTQGICEAPSYYVPSYGLDASPDIGFVLSDIEIAATDGAQANGKKDNSSEIVGASVTQVITWELQIHAQGSP